MHTFKRSAPCQKRKVAIIDKISKIDRRRARFHAGPSIREGVGGSLGYQRAFVYVDGGTCALLIKLNSVEDCTQGLEVVNDYAIVIHIAPD